MGWKCAVPNCAIQRKKYIKFLKYPLMPIYVGNGYAVPSVSTLCVTERVCEKHFEKDLTIREYI